jgi:hypothetical protein
MNGRPEPTITSRSGCVLATLRLFRSRPINVTRKPLQRGHTPADRRVSAASDQAACLPIVRTNTGIAFADGVLLLLS